MEIKSINRINEYKTFCIQKRNPKIFCNPLTPLGMDTVCFKGGNSQRVQKNDFNSLDRALVEKFRVDISGFKSTDDLQIWALKKLEKSFLSRSFANETRQAQIQRKAMLEEWYDYVTKENDEYPPVLQVLILNAVMKGIRHDNDVQPPALNKGALADTVQELITITEKNPIEGFSFRKMYEQNLKKTYLEKYNRETDYTGWVVLKSYENDSENFALNVNKLKTLSCSSWCTRSYNAEPYLKKGDFHIYLQNGKAKIGVRFVGDKIREIQGERNNAQIPAKYYETVKDYLESNKFETEPKAAEQLKQAQEINRRIIRTKKELKDPIEKNDVKKILEHFNIKVRKDRTGKFTISHYEQPKEYGLTFEDYGIDEAKLFEKIKCISKNASFKNSKLKKLGALEQIGGDADFSKSSVVDLGELKQISGDANFIKSRIKSLGKLKKIEGNALFYDSQITESGELEEIGGNADFEFSLISDLKNLKKIGGNACFGNSSVTNLGKLAYIGATADFSDSKIIDLGDLRYIGGFVDFTDSKVENTGKLSRLHSFVLNENSSLTDMGGVKLVKHNADFSNSKIKSLGNIEKIEGDVRFCNSEITDLGKLRVIGGNAKFSDSKIENLGGLKTIKGNADFSYSGVKDLGSLKEIKGCANFEDSKLESLGGLTKIGKDALFSDSGVKDLGALKYIGGSAIFDNTKIKSLKKLKSIGEFVTFNDSEIEDLGDLKKIGGRIWCKNPRLNKMLKDRGFVNIYTD